MNRIALLALALGGSALALAVNARPVTYQLPEETAAFKPGPNLDSAQGNCGACHSADYVLTQPPTTTRAQWKAIVEKMRQRFGASLPAEQVDVVADYLAKTYGSDQPKN